MFAVVRYGRWSPEHEKVDGEGNPVQRRNRLTVGLGYRIAERAEVRCEFQKNDEKDVELDYDVITLQVVVGY